MSSSSTSGTPKRARTPIPDKRSLKRTRLMSEYIGTVGIQRNGNLASSSLSHQQQASTSASGGLTSQRVSSNRGTEDGEISGIAHASQIPYSRQQSAEV